MKIFLKRLPLRILTVIIFGSILYLILLLNGVVSLPSASADTVTSATLQDSTVKADGSYVVLINRKLHDRSGTTEDWNKFFSFDDNVPLIMEDITCSVASSDSEGIDTAKIYQSRLPENQMKLNKENGLFMISKAEVGKFDVIIMSNVTANSLSAETLYDRADILTIKVEGT